MFEEHFCLVLELYESTLLNFVSFPSVPADSSGVKTAPASDFMLNSGNGVNNGLMVLQPR